MTNDTQDVQADSTEAAARVDPNAGNNNAQESVPERTGVSGLQVIQSTFAAAFGVQSSKNRERDFQQGRASQFIVAGILFTLMFIGVMVLIVRTVLSGT